MPRFVEWFSGASFLIKCNSAAWAVSTLQHSSRDDSQPHKRGEGSYKDGSVHPQRFEIQNPKLQVPLSLFSPASIYLPLSTEALPVFYPLFTRSKSSPEIFTHYQQVPNSQSPQPNHKLTFCTPTATMPQKPCWHCGVELNASTHICQACSQSAGTQIKAFEACNTEGCCEDAITHNPT
jgi:hypothetical protein